MNETEPGIDNQVNIRTANEDDVEAIVDIYIESWNEGFLGLMPQREVTAELVERWKHDLMVPLPKRWWVAEVDATIVGFAGIGPSRDPIDPSIGELDTIAIAPHMWRRGIGQALFTTAYQSLIADGYQEAIIWTLANYERGQRFYEAMGWTLDGATRDDGRQVQYRRRLVS